jgi:hypothetical protein
MRPLLAAVAILSLASPILANPPATALRAATPCDWEALFRDGSVGCGPLGPTRGTVLYADGRHPRMKVRRQGLLWKGKTFHGDGTITNRWLGGVQMVSAAAGVGPSWLDGRPCLVIQYAPDAAVFGNVRDELRLIGPGEWLGRSYDAATGRLKNWFVLHEE